MRFVSGEPGVGMDAAEWVVARRVALTGADLARRFLVPQTLNVRHGLFIMENLATEMLARARVYEFMFVLTRQKTRGSTAAMIAPAAVT